MLAATCTHGPQRNLAHVTQLFRWWPVSLWMHGDGCDSSCARIGLDKIHVHVSVRTKATNAPATLFYGLRETFKSSAHLTSSLIQSSASLVYHPESSLGSSAPIVESNQTLTRSRSCQGSSPPGREGWCWLVGPTYNNGQLNSPNKRCWLCCHVSPDGWVTL